MGKDVCTLNTMIHSDKNQKDIFIMKYLDQYTSQGKGNTRAAESPGLDSCSKMEPMKYFLGDFNNEILSSVDDKSSISDLNLWKA